MKKFFFKLKKMHLREIIDLNSLQKIQDSIADVVEMAIITVDEEGKPITKHSRCCEFCNKIRNNKKYKNLCQKCDLEAGIQAVNLKKTYVHRCHAGLIDFAIPIVVDGVYLGAVMTGQVKIEDEENLKKIGQVYFEKRELINKNLIPSEVIIVDTQKMIKVIKMMQNITNYIVEEALLKITTKEKNRLQKEFKKAKLNALKSQLNPHFLFNVLNSMSALAIIENAPKTRNVILNLSKMLRYTLKKSNQLVTLKEEIDYVESYLKLQKIRFEDRLDYEIKLEESTKKELIPFMLVQVFVENSVIHAIEPNDKKSKIVIESKMEDSKFLLLIKDDGIGMSIEKLKDVRDCIENPDKEFERIGIQNVSKRMFYYFEDNYKIKIQSYPENGTVIKIQIDNKK